MIQHKCTALLLRGHSPLLQYILSDDHLCCQTSIRLPRVSPGDHGAAGLQARQGHPPVRPARHRQDPHGPPDRSDAQLQGAQDR